MEKVQSGSCFCFKKIAPEFLDRHIFGPVIQIEPKSHPKLKPPPHSQQSTKAQAFFCSIREADVDESSSDPATIFQATMENACCENEVRCFDCDVGYLLVLVSEYGWVREHIHNKEVRWRARASAASSFVRSGPTLPWPRGHDHGWPDFISILYLHVISPNFLLIIVKKNINQTGLRQGIRSDEAADEQRDRRQALAPRS